MPKCCRDTDVAERLAQAAFHARQLVALLESVAPGIVDTLGNGHAPSASRASRGITHLDTPVGNDSPRPAIIDEATLSVRWAGRTCRLGDTKPFKLLQRLARRPNVFISCDSLLDEIWDEHTSCAAVRSAAKVLRRKLTAAGMEDLATAIDGSVAHHYALTLTGL